MTVCSRFLSFCGGGGRRAPSLPFLFWGGGGDGQAAVLAINGGADVLVSADIAHHMITGLFYNGVNVVQLTHYASEVYGFKKIAQSLAPSLGCSVCVYVDAQLM